MDGLEVGWLETVLRRRSADSSVARILTARCQSAVGPGENYASVLKRMHMTVVLGSGRVADKSLILKKEISEFKKQLERFDYFKTETKMYATIIPLMEELMDEHGDCGDYMWCDYYGTTGDVLVFEDLQTKGFRVADRRSGLDINHALLTLKNMARFHAMSAVLLMRGAVKTGQLQSSFLSLNDDVMNQFYKGGINTLADTMISNWDSKWSQTAANLRSIGDELGSTLQELYRLDGSKFQVINHGDCWVNNILYKYQQDSNYPIGMRFVDYQCSHCNSYGWDLMYFIYSSVKPSVRRSHFDEIVSTYHRNLISTLEFYNSVPENAPTKEDVQAEMERLLVVGLMVSCTLLSVTMADPKDAMDVKGMVENKRFHNDNMYSSEKYTAVIQQDLQFFIEKGLL